MPVVGTHVGAGRRQRRGKAGPLQSAERLAMFRSLPLGNPVALTGGKNIVVTRAQIFLGRQPFSRIRFRFASWFHTSGAVIINKEQAGPQGLSIVGAAIERRTFGSPSFVTAPLTFGGQRNATLPDGDSEIWSDWLDASWGSPAQPWSENSQYYMRTAIDAGPDGQFPRWTNLATSLSATLREGGVLATSVNPSAIRAVVDASGDIDAAAFSDGAAVNYGFGPILAVGTPAAPIVGDLSVIAQGSSFVEGSGDGGFTGSITSGGFLLRGTNSIGSPTRKLPLANYARGSGMWHEIADSNARRERAWQHARVLLLDGPTNDIASSLSAASILSKWDKIKARAAIYGLFKIVTLVAPRTTGTYADDAGQTPTIGFGIGGVRDQVNAALIARWQAGEIDILIDPNLGRIGLRDRTTWLDLDAGTGNLRLQSQTAADRWAASQTTDGIHPNPAGHARMAALLDWALEDIWTNHGAIFP